MTEYTIAQLNEIVDQARAKKILVTKNKKSKAGLRITLSQNALIHLVDLTEQSSGTNLNHYLYRTFKEYLVKHGWNEKYRANHFIH